MKLMNKVTATLLSLLALSGPAASANASHQNVHHHKRTRISRHLKRHSFRHHHLHKYMDRFIHHAQPAHVYRHNGPYHLSAPAAAFASAAPQPSAQTNSSSITANRAPKAKVQAVSQKKPTLVKKVHKKVAKQAVQQQTQPAASKHISWFKDGLSKHQLSARNWITWHESGHQWDILSYGHVCVGYFQLNPAYLGYKDGHVNLNHKHQVKVADAYVASRYGSWTNAKCFWQAHHWY